MKLPWYAKMNEWLEPAQDVVTVLLVIIALVCLYLAFSPSARVSRTGILVYLLSP